MDNFKWTDELVEEYSKSTEDLDSFKRRKSKPKPVYTTDDGVDVFAGDVVWYVEITSLDYGQIMVAKLSGKNIDKYKYLSTQEKAKEFVVHNVKSLTLKDVLEVVRDTVLMDGDEYKKLEDALFKLTYSIVNP